MIILIVELALIFEFSLVFIRRKTLVSLFVPWRDQEDFSSPSPTQSFFDRWNHQFVFFLICFPATKPAFSLALSYSCAPITSLSFAKPSCE